MSELFTREDVRVAVQHERAKLSERIRTLSREIERKDALIQEQREALARREGARDAWRDVAKAAAQLLEDAAVHLRNLPAGSEQKDREMWERIEAFLRERGL